MKKQKDCIPEQNQQLQHLARVSLQLNQMETTSEITSFLCDEIKSMIGPGQVVVTLMDDATQSLGVKAIRGFDDDKLINAALRLTGVDPRNMRYPVQGLTPEEHAIFRSSSLIPVKDGLYSILIHKFPRAVCTAIETLFGIRNIYIMGFSHHNRYLGTVSIFTDSNSSLEANKLIIENIVAQAAVIISRGETDILLKRNERKFRELSEGISDIFFAMDRELKYTYWNKASERITGIKAEDAVGKSIGDLFPENEPRELARHMYEKALQTNDAQHFILRYPGGTHLVHDISVYPNQDGIAVFVKDITAQTLTENNLRLSQQKLALHFDKTPLAVIEFDTNGIIHEWNPAACTVFGYSREEALGQHWSFLVPPNIRENPDTIWEAVGGLTAGARSTNENITKDGRVIKCEWFNTPLVDSNGSVIGVASLIQDITARKKAEDELLKNNQQLEVLFDASRGMSLSLDLKEVCRTLLRTMSRVMSFDTMIISSFNPADNLIRCLYVFDKDTKEGDTSVFPPLELELEGNGPQHVVIRTGKAALLNDYETHFKSAAKHFYIDGNGSVTTEIPDDEERSRSAILVPLKSQNQVIGVLQVLSNRLNNFTEDNLNLVESISAHAAASITNALLYARVQNELTELTKAEGLISESESKFHSLFSSMTEGVALHQITYSPEGQPVNYRIVDANPSFESQTGLKIKDIRGQLATEAYQTDPPPYWEEYEKVARTGEPYSFESYFQPLGKTFAISVYSPKPGWFATIFSDITERKQSEIKLVKSREQLAKAQKTAQVGSWTWHINQNKLEWSDEMFRIFGIDKTCFSGNLSEIVNNSIHPDDRAAVDASNLSVSQKGKPIPLEYRIIRPDGSIRTVWAEAGEIILTEDAKPEVLTGIVMDITDRKRIEEALKIREAGLDEAQRVSHIGSWEWDMLLNKVNWSKEMYRVFDIDPDTYDGTPEVLMKKIHPDDVEKYINSVNTNRADGTSPTLEYRVVHRDGSVHTVSAEGKTTFDHSGKPVKAVGTVQDITERKKIEASLRKNEKDIVALVHNSPDMIVRFNTELRHMYCNPAVERLTGVPADYFIGKSFLDIQNPGEPNEQNIARHQALRTCLETGEEQKFEQAMPTIAGLKYIATQIVAERNEGGVIESLLAISHDITERRIVEEALAKNETRFRQIAEDADEWIWEVNAEGLYTYCSPAVEGILGYSPEELVGIKHFYDLYAPDVKEELKQKAFAGFKSKNITKKLINHNLHKNGTTVILETNGSPIVDEKGNMVGYRGADTDVTEREKAEQELRQRNHELSVINKISQRLDQLNNPLEIIDSIYAEVSSLTDTGNLYIAQYDNQNQYISFDLYYIEGVRHEISGRILANGVTDYIIRSKTPILVKRDFATFLQTHDIELIGKPSLSFLGVPIIADDKVIGVLATQDYNRENAYEENDLELWTTIAAQASGALKNAQLFKALQKELDEHKKTEDALIRDEAKFRGTFDHSSVGSAIIGLDKRFIRLNTAFCKFLGYVESELIGKTIADVTYPEDIEIGMKEMKQMAEGEITSCRLQKRYLHKDGSIVWGEIGFSLVYDADGKPLYFIPIIQDITERKRAEAALLESEGKYRSIAETATEGIMLSKPDGTITYANKRLAEMLGCTTDELIGKAGASFMRNQKPAEQMRQTFEKQDSEDKDFEIIRSDGSKQWMLVNAAPIIGDKGHKLATLAMFTDITERKIAEDKVKASLAEKEVILKEIHHRVKNNMQVISSLLQLQSGFVKNKDDAIRFQESQRRIHSMGLVYNKLYQSDDLAHISLNEYVRDLVTSLVQAYNSRLETITTSIDVKDIELGLDLAVPCGLIINEVITNSLKYAFPEGRAGEIRIMIQRTEDQIQMLLGDNGKGLPEGLTIGNTNSLGMVLIQTLVENQLEGTLDLNGANGTEYRISFPFKPNKG